MSVEAVSWKGRFIAIRSNKVFEMAVIAIIILSAMMIGAATYDIDPTWLSVLKFFDIAMSRSSKLSLVRVDGS